MVDAVTRFLDRKDTLLARLDEQLQRAADIPEAAKTLCEYTGRELNLADCVVYLPEGDNGLYLQAAWGARRGTQRLPDSRLHLPIGRDVAGDCARLLELQRMDDARADPRHPPRTDPPPPELALVEPARSELAAPISHDHLLLGVLDSEDPAPGFYDARYERVFQGIADCSAPHFWRLRR